MEEEKFSLSGTFQKTKEYVDSQLKLIRLKAIERSSRLIGSLVLDATKLLLTLFIVFFLCFALAFWMGELLGSNSLGFLATAGIFLILLLIIRAVEPQLEAKFMDLSIRRFFGKLTDDDDDEEEETQSNIEKVDTNKNDKIENEQLKDEEAN